MNGKGDKRRPSKIPRKEFESRWDIIFNNQYFSECCDAYPSNEVNKVDGEKIGMCSSCGEWATFYSDESDDDWTDQIEYMVEHP